MTDSAALLRDLRRELAALEDDLRRRTDEPGTLGDELRSEHAEALGRGRTAATYSEWRDEQVTQAAVAWLLGCVFVNSCGVLLNSFGLRHPNAQHSSRAMLA